MATLNLTTKEFADIAMIWFLDQVVNPEQVNNEQFSKFIEDHRSKLKAPLLNYFLNTDTQRRLEYRRISKVFANKDSNIQQIRIGPDEPTKEKDKKKDGKVKNVIKKVLKKEELTLDDINMLKEMSHAYEEIHDES